MWKKWTALLLALMCVAAPALAEIYEGVTAARSTVTVFAEDSGTVEAVAAEAGQRVAAEETLIRLRADRTFASQDGTVSLVSAKTGDAVGGTVLELAPVERYTIHCTVDKAYQSTASTLVHSGETVYVKCTADGTHRAIGVVTQIDGSEYRVMTLGGELYVGETVYLYRDADFTAAQRVGIGTVLVSDTETYSAEGELTLLRVQPGDAVERGQLLYETGGGEITAPAGGIVASVSCQPGDAVAKGDAVAEIVPPEAVCAEIQVEETDVTRIAVGDAAWITCAGQEESAAIPGEVVAISAIAESELYAVWVRPAQGDALPLGMSVSVRI